MNFEDEYSRFMWIFPMVNKSKAFPIFVKFHAFVSNKFNTLIKCFQSDGGEEFMSKMLCDFWQIRELNTWFHAFIPLRKMVLLRGNTDV